MTNSQDTTWPTTLRALFNEKKKRFKFPKHTFEPGQTYIIKAYVTTSPDSTEAGTATITLKT
jgi:hypothetical protein